MQWTPVGTLPHPHWMQHATHDATKWSQVPIVRIVHCLAHALCSGLLLKQGHSRRLLLHITRQNLSSGREMELVGLSCSGPVGKVL